MIVCGCGPSLNNLEGAPPCLTIGVNDVGRHLQPTYLVVVNPPDQFRDQRFSKVTNSSAQAVFSQYAELPLEHAPLINFRLGSYNGTDFSNPNVLHYTQNSPYVALCLAIHMGATRIGLIGVDFTDDHFFGPTGPHPLAARLPQIDAEYARLRDACTQVGVEVVNLSPISRLTAFPRAKLETFLRDAKPPSRAAKGLRIVSYATTPVAGVPAILARCISARTNHIARCVWATNDYGNGVRFEGDLEWAGKPDEAEAVLAEADLVIAHNGRIDPRHKSVLAGKPIITMAHNYAWNVDTTFVRQGMPGMVVGQYQATLPEFAGWTPVPNPVPLWEPAFSPGPKADVLTIAYTPSGRHESYPENHRLYWHGKGYETTMRVLDTLASRYSIELVTVRDSQFSHAEALAAKRRAHIVIDECVTGSYHRNSLEGLSCGAVVVNGVGLRAAVSEMLRHCAGDTPEMPFAHATQATLENVLASLIEQGSGALAASGKRSRAWMETHWNFARQWGHVWEPAITRALDSRTGRAQTVHLPMQRTQSMQTQCKPRVSVVIPHGGRERIKLLAATLAGLQAIRGIDEIVVAELAEQPAAAETARDAGARYAFIHHEGVFNKSRALNAGSALASGDLLLWLDNDLSVPEDFVVKACAELQARQLDCLVPWTSVLYLSPGDSAAVADGTRKAASCKPINAYHTKAGACGGVVLVRADFVRRHGGLDETFRGWGGEDNAWFHKAQVLGRAAVTQRSDQLVFHLHHAGSGGNGGRAHIDANPHYADNFARLMAMRRITDRARFAAAFPPAPLPALDWRTEGGTEDLAGALLAPSTRRALVAAGTGIGDILRATPMVRALAENGYRVTMLIVADYPGTATLVRDRRWVDEVIETAAPKPGQPPLPCPSLAGAEEYDFAVFSHLAAPFQPQVRARAVHVFDRIAWLADGDTAGFSSIAAVLGLPGNLPAPFAVASARRFDLPAGTVALHAGCKRGWAFKRWPGFAVLAESLAHVVIVGTPEDEGPAWPPHVQRFLGLDLPDTAALLSQCAALVANDSGLMHLGAALGVQTFGIFGLTSPRREALALPNMHAITKALACEAACHAGPLGRRNCEHRLRCLKELSAREVLERIRPHLPAAALRGAQPTRQTPPEKLNIALRIDGGVGDLVLAARFVEGLFLGLDHCNIEVFHNSAEAAQFVFHRARHVRAIHDAAAFKGLAGGTDIAIVVAHLIRYEIRDWARIELLCPVGASGLRSAIAQFELHRGVFERRPSLDAFWARLSVLGGRNAAAGFDLLAGFPLHPLPMLAPDPAGYVQLRDRLPALGGGYITVHDGFDSTMRIASGGATKCWPIGHWAELVARLRAKYPGVAIVQLGGPKSRSIPGVDLDLVRQTTWHQTAWILKRGLLHIDGDSGLVHLARALSARSVVLFGPTDRGYYGYETNRNIGPTECGNCWWSTPDWLEKCPRGLAQPACMASIQPGAVMTEVAALMTPGPVARATLLDRALYDTGMPSVGASTLADIFIHAGLPQVPISSHATNPVSGVYLHASKQWEYLFALDAIARHGRSQGILRIADVGGGRGALAPHLAHSGREVTVFDLDFLWDHCGDLDIERRYMTEASRRGWRARFGSIYSLPVEDAAFDVALCISVVEHAPYKDLMLQELLRVVRPGGLVVLTFDFAAEPEVFRDGVRVDIFGPPTLDAALAGIGADGASFSLAEIDASTAAIALDAVAGIPAGMTVGGVVLQKVPG